jgi:hypothetical protein
MALFSTPQASGSTKRNYEVHVAVFVWLIVAGLFLVLANVFAAQW